MAEGGQTGRRALGTAGGRSQACSRVERVLSKAAAVLVGSGGSLGRGVGGLVHAQQ